MLQSCDLAVKALDSLVKGRGFESNATWKWCQCHTRWIDGTWLTFLMLKMIDEPTACWDVKKIPDEGETGLDDSADPGLLGVAGHEGEGLPPETTTDRGRNFSVSRARSLKSEKM